MPPAWHKGPPQPVQRVGGCTGKVRHGTEHEARALLRRRGHLRAYYCRHCDGWHTTSQRKWGRL